MPRETVLEHDASVGPIGTSDPQAEACASRTGPATGRPSCDAIPQGLAWRLLPRRKACVIALLLRA
ncbi:MAG TPA: hypothetical protein VEU47_09375, partial [Candidatus Cybelea sp.]|nr:hypothetical protein [Candidatus Cybelea sp.]